MAIIWQCRSGDKLYEVRRAGRSLRLYTNGAFHSQYNPHRLFTGAVWDLLTLPALYNPHIPQRTLMLGVGGGTAIHQLNKLAAGCDITAIELNPVHLDVARRFFRVETPNVHLIEADALQWIKRRRATWDLVIDDLFLDAREDPERPRPVDEHWLEQLAARSGDHGVVVQNHLSPRLARGLVREHEALLKAHFRTALLFTTPQYENGVLALYRHRIEPARAGLLARERVTRIDRPAWRQLKFDCTTLFQVNRV